MVRLEDEDIDVAAVMETKVIGTDLSTPDWKWFLGPEALPKAGGSTPRMGLGFLVRSVRFPLASVVSKGKYTVWLHLPGEERDLFLCSAYIPVYNRDKAPALKEIWEGYREYSKKGLAVMGGDLNARCGANGDHVVNSEGRQLMKSCKDEAASIANLVPGRCTGEFRAGGHTKKWG